VSPRLAKALRVLGFAAYAIAMAAVFVLTAYASFSLFVRSGATRVPEIEGLRRDEARGVLADSGLRLALAEGGRYDAEVPTGRLLAQLPAPSTLVKRGATVTATVSLGPQRLEAPELTGKSLQSAQVTAAAGGVTMGRILSIYRDGAAPNTVVVQSPEPGELLPPEGMVDVLLARAGSAQRFVMPDLVYRDYETVRRFFDRTGVRLGRVTFEVYEGTREGMILRQFPLAGHPLTRRDAISLVVAAPADALGDGDGLTGAGRPSRPTAGGPADAAPSPTPPASGSGP